MAKAKGIRVNQLAKELAIPSKLILDKIKAEGLGDKVPNHIRFAAVMDLRGSHCLACDAIH